MRRSRARLAEHAQAYTVHSIGYVALHPTFAYLLVQYTHRIPNRVYISLMMRLQFTSIVNFQPYGLITYS
jgi:hypothetical protein